MPDPRTTPRRTPLGRTRRGLPVAPTPANRTGTPSPSSIAKTIPPRAVESSLVRTMPVSPTDSWNAAAGQAVLAGRRVEDEQRLWARIRQSPADDAPDLRELVHEVRLRVQPARGVDQHDVRPPCHRGIEASNTTAAGSAPGAWRRCRRRLSRPRSRLVAGRGAERIGGGEDDASAGSRLRVASLPMVVVLPVPLTPTIRTTAGGSPGPRAASPRVVARTARSAHVGPRLRRHRARPARGLDDLGGKRADVAGDRALLDLVPVSGSIALSTSSPRRRAMKPLRLRRRPFSRSRWRVPGPSPVRWSPCGGAVSDPAAPAPSAARERRRLVEAEG